MDTKPGVMSDGVKLILKQDMSANSKFYSKFTI